MSHIDITQEASTPDASFTPEQEDAVCQLIQQHDWVAAIISGRCH